MLAQVKEQSNWREMAAKDPGDGGAGAEAGGDGAEEDPIAAVTRIIGERAGSDGG